MRFRLSMDKFKAYNVQFSGLNEGEHDFKFQIDQSFFDLFEFNQDFNQPSIQVKLTLVKKSTFMELHFWHQGTVLLECDVTNDEYTEDVEGDMDVIVKFGNEFDDSDDEVMILPYGEHSINIAQLIYESILLSIPNKRVKPNLSEEELDLLDQFSPFDKEENSDNDDSDPRWDELKKILNKN